MSTRQAAFTSLAQLFFHSYQLELVLRGIGGIVGSGLSSFCLFYVMQAFPAKSRLAGMVLASASRSSPCRWRARSRRCCWPTATCRTCLPSSSD